MTEGPGQQPPQEPRRNADGAGEREVLEGRVIPSRAQSQQDGDPRRQFRRQSPPPQAPEPGPAWSPQADAAVEAAPWPRAQAGEPWNQGLQQPALDPTAHQDPAPQQPQPPAEQGPARHAAPPQAYASGPDAPAPQAQATHPQAYAPQQAPQARTPQPGYDPQQALQPQAQAPQQGHGPQVQAPQPQAYDGGPQAQPPSPQPPAPTQQHVQAPQQAYDPQAQALQPQGRAAHPQAYAAGPQAATPQAPAQQAPQPQGPQPQPAQGGGAGHVPFAGGPAPRPAPRVQTRTETSPPADPDTPDWGALADEQASGSRRRRVLMLTGGIVAVAVIAGGVATAVVMSGKSSDDKPTAGSSSTGTSTGLQSLPPVPSFSSVAPPPPANPLDYINTAAKDTAPITPASLFPGKQFVWQGRTYAKTTSDVTTSCAKNARGKVAAALAANGCQKLIRATYTQGALAVTVGVAVFRDDTHAKKVSGVSQYVAPLNGGGVADFCHAVRCQMTANSVGRYAYFAIAGFKNGTTLATDDTVGKQAANDASDFAFNRIVQRGKDAAAADPSRQ